ncbi:Hypothetical predicted protein [Paramuricea clavata]|uniref:Uncharacterized protein n=1 Tax=Paramuricea clavata TaxID=317549 RepID=A0A6S7FQB5_PARCT|nr:Hypothetical predicted protein [Paramuricea clavata]
MLDIFAAAGHHQYAKGARLYCQLMKQLQATPRFIEIFERFTVYGNHVVRYSCHDWSGTWTDICIEQTLMKAAKSEAHGGKCQETWSTPQKPHKDLTKTRMERNAEAIALVLKLFDENNSFDHDRDNKLLVSFSTGFTSKAGDAVNAERAFEVGREMQIKLNGSQ